MVSPSLPGLLAFVESQNVQANVNRVGVKVLGCAPLISKPAEVAV
jgi:hypothetical protein